MGLIRNSHLSAGKHRPGQYHRKSIKSGRDGKSLESRSCGDLRRRTPLLWSAFTILGTFGLFVAGAFSSQEAAAPAEGVVSPGADGWVSLFEGATLRGWEPMAEHGWKVIDSVLTGRKGGIASRWCWVDFELTMLFQGDGLVRFRVGSDQMGHIGFGQPGYYLDLSKGTLYTAEGKLLVEAKGPWPRSGWHALVLSASKGILSIALDSEPATKVSNSEFPLKGRIGLEAADEGLQVKYLRIRPLNQEVLSNIPADNYYCYVCHANFEYEDALAETHLEVDVGCADCHGPSLAHRSDEDNVTPPDIIFRRPQVDGACLGCHTRHEEREAPAGTTLPNDPICTDCHGDHRI